MNWDEYYIKIADVIRQKSKDPSSQIGAVLVNHQNAIISTGFNGFPIGIDEKDPSRWERPIKYQYVCHAERNALAFAARYGIPTQGSTLYLVGFGPPTVPCTECTKMAIQCGVKRIVGASYKLAYEAWIDDLRFSKELLQEANIEFVEL